MALDVRADAVTGIAPAGEVYLAPLTPLQFLERSAWTYREQPAVRYGTLRRTYPELQARVNRLASALEGAGIGAGDRVAVLLPNVPPMLEAHFAVPLMGGVLVPVNIRLLADEIAFILAHSGARALIYDTEYAPIAARIKSEQHKVELFVAYRDDQRGDESGPTTDPDYEEFIARGSDAQRREASVDENATISINYTSGTTGRPKGVMYSHRGAFVNALGEIVETGLRPDSVYLWTLPMFHCNGWIFPWAVTAAGATHVLLRKVDPPLIWRLIESEGVTHLCGAPTVLIALANDPNAHELERTLNVTTAGAPPSPKIIRQMESLGARITHVYGLTETYGPITVCAWQSRWDDEPDERRAVLKSRQGVGYVSAGNYIRVVDEHMHDVPRDGETMGEIVMRGNNVMKGYYADPDATAKAFAGGWFHSGDLAVWHPDGYLEIRDRGKDVIISGGENISTQQVEKVIVEHPAVLEAAVVAVPHDKWGEVPKAFVTLRPGESTTEAEIIAFARERLPGFKCPKAVEFGDLPKTSTGKIQKYILREREWRGRDKLVN